MIYDTSSSLYKSFLKRLLWQSLALNILRRDHGDAFKHSACFACILKSKVAVGCLEEILSRYGRQRDLGLLTGFTFTAKEIAAVGKVFLTHFLKLRKVYLTGKWHSCKQREFKTDYPVWNYWFSLLKEASGLGKSRGFRITSHGLLLKQDIRLGSSLTAGTPGTFYMRKTEELQDAWGSSLRGLSPALLEKPISGKVCWWCSGKTDTKLQKCSRCNIAHYCSRQCQKNDWPGHMTDCGILQVWSPDIIKLCRRPGNSDATTIEEALVQKRKSEMFDHAKNYKKTDFMLRKRDLCLKMFSSLDCNSNTKTPCDKGKVSGKNGCISDWHHAD